MKNPQCEICNQNEYWNGRRMALILDHINGNRYDNRIDNLQIVCPNCNATLDTHCRGNQEKKAGLYKEGTHIKLKECSTENCGNLIRIASSVCKNCYFKNKSRKIKISTTKRETRKSIRPPYQQLLLEIQEFGYRGTGKKYNVSDNAIRKWVKMYEKYGDNF